jgi:hypothetical protein
MAAAAPSVVNDACTLLLSYDFLEKRPSVTFNEVMKQIESKDDDEKIDTLKHIIGMLLSGDSNCGKLLIPVIKGCLRSENHMIKKLLLIYWEVVERYVPGTSKLLPEFILVWYVGSAIPSHACICLSKISQRKCALENPCSLVCFLWSVEIILTSCFDSKL